MSNAYYEPSDDVDILLAEERFEESDEYIVILRNWLATADLPLQWAREEFIFDGSLYANEFAKWMREQQP